MLLDIAIIVFLMVAAILLILAEIFLLPGITLAGIGGAIFAIGGVVFAYTVGIWVGHLTLSLSIITFGIIFAWLLRSRSFNKIALKTDIDSKLISSRDLGIEPGDEGITLSRLAPRFKNPDSNPGSVVISTLLFFLFAIGVGFVLFKVFQYLDNKYPHTRRIPILGLALCFIFAYVAEVFFGIADITGAYVAGIILCSIQDSEYIAEKMDINSYMIFGPIFFASIGLKTSFDHLNGEFVLFSIGFVIVALLCKIIGCGLMARICRFKGPDALKIGVGMMTRGEVALIVAQKGLSVGMIGAEYFTAVILLIIVSSISTPILLKILYTKHAEID